MDKQEEKVYCVKYALTSGIFFMTGTEEPNGRFMRCENGFYTSFSSKEWDRTAAGALEKSKALLEKKLKLLEKQQDKLRNLKLELPCNTA
jgi:hypothetical protein